MSGEMIPIVMFAVIGLVVIAYFYWNNKNRQAILETVQKTIESGGDLGVELLEQLGGVNPRIRDLRRGVIFLSLGVAGLLCSLFFADADVVNGIRAGTMFPLLLGVGFLVVWRLARD